MIQESTIVDALREVYDPEIPVNLVDLGLIYGTSIDDGNVNIKMTLTTKACPMRSNIAQMVKEAVEILDDVKEVTVDIVWEPLWNPEMISPKGRLAMGMD